MIKEILSHINGIEFFGVTQLLIFFSVFCLIIYKVWKLDRTVVQYVERLPLEETDQKSKE
jgi:hypothetical protein